VRAVLDPNVLIAAALSPGGSPARVLRLWLEGAFELVVSPLLLAELQRALAYPKLRQRITPDEAREVVDLLRAAADHHADPSDPPPVRSVDPGDDYLLALAAVTDAVIVTCDRHLLTLGEHHPVYTPAAFLAELGEE
jgi:putative PIN family toxin of toxin-antitoxin system